MSTGTCKLVDATYSFKMFNSFLLRNLYIYLKGTR